MPRSGEMCFGTRRAFEPGEEFKVYLYDTPDGYERRDYALDYEPPAEPAPLATWRTHRATETTRKLQAFDPQAVQMFFERLADATTPQQVQFRFVLALLLWRKKALRLERTRQVDEHEVWHFIAPRTGVLHDVTRPELDEAELESLSSQLEQLLAGQPVAISSPALQFEELADE